jgi:hypothetical protein
LIGLIDIIDLSFSTFIFIIQFSYIHFGHLQGATILIDVCSVYGDLSDHFQTIYMYVVSCDNMMTIVVVHNNTETLCSQLVLKFECIKTVTWKIFNIQ